VGVSAAAMVLDFQVVQKFHAVTDPHDPPTHLNDRARDLVDLLLLRRAFYLSSSSDQLNELRRVAVDVFDTRAREAYKAARDGVGRDNDELPSEVQEAAGEVGDWIAEIDSNSTR
jgi:hypothetical protein